MSFNQCHPTLRLPLSLSLLFREGCHLELPCMERTANRYPQHPGSHPRHHKRIRRRPPIIHLQRILPRANTRRLLLSTTGTETGIGTWGVEGHAHPRRITLCDCLPRFILPTTTRVGGRHHLTTATARRPWPITPINKADMIKVKLKPANGLVRVGLRRQGLYLNRNQWVPRA